MAACPVPSGAILPMFCHSVLLALSWTPFQMSDSCDCHAVNARYNVVAQAKTGYDYVPVVPDDSLGFYVAYSAKQNDANTDFVSTSCMYVLPLDNDEVLIFGGGFGDTYYLSGGAFFDADYDVAMIKEAILGCMGRTLSTRIRFVAPHGHPDHITVAFIRALERAGFTLAEIAYQVGDRAWIEGLPWLPHHPALFNPLPTAPCNREILSYSSPLGHIGFISRPGHTPGSIDLVLDVGGDPSQRVLVMGSMAGGCAPPPGVVLTLAAHGTAIVGGPRRAMSEMLTGSGKNRACLRSVTAPKPGEAWVTEVEVEGHPGATSLLLFGTDCRLESGQPTAYGELLVDLLGQHPFSITRSVLNGSIESIEVEIPKDPTLMGRTFYAQAAIAGGGAELCNALRLVIGF